jgi:Protein of unknown function (DUF3800)
MEKQEAGKGKPTFIAFIDESGDEGFRFHAGNSEWFVLSAVVGRKKDEIETVKLVDAVRDHLKSPITSLSISAI